MPWDFVGAQFPNSVLHAWFVSILYVDTSPTPWQGWYINRELTNKRTVALIPGQASPKSPSQFITHYILPGNKLELIKNECKHFKKNHQRDFISWLLYFISWLLYMSRLDVVDLRQAMVQSTIWNEVSWDHVATGLFSTCLFQIPWRGNTHFF